MNYLPFVGGWFYGATSGEERASYYSSWGLLALAPLPPLPPVGKWREQGILGMLI